MAADGTVDKIAQKYADYNLPECVCIGKNTDVKETTSAQKEKVSKNTDSDTAQEEHVGFVGKMKQGFANFGNITKQLCKGFGATLSIFFLTMIISLPLGLLVTFGRMTKDYTDPLDHKNIYFYYAWYAIDASASGCILWSILSFWY